MLQAGGGTLGSDCVLAVFVRVFVVKVRGHVVISAFLLSLFVKHHRPLE
jgi:hypothetical protein